MRSGPTLLPKWKGREWQEDVESRFTPTKRPVKLSILTEEIPRLNTLETKFQAAGNEISSLYLKQRLDRWVRLPRAPNHCNNETGTQEASDNASNHILHVLAPYGVDGAQ